MQNLIYLKLCYLYIYNNYIIIYLDLHIIEFFYIGKNIYLRLI